MKPRSKPRYRDPEKASSKPKERPLVLRKTTPLRFWGGLAFRWGVLYTALPLALLWVGNLFLNPYRVHFDERPRSIKLDGAAIALDSANGFDFSRFAFGDHLLRYVDAQGTSKTVRLHAKPNDENGDLAITDHRLSGIPKAEFITSP